MIQLDSHCNYFYGILDDASHETRRWLGVNGNAPERINV